MFLKGIRVLDLTCLLPGPYATTRLADLGADVICVEPAPDGDPARHIGEQVSGTGVVWLATHRNKHCVQLDLKSADGQRVVRELIREADVIVDGFRPGVADRLGVGYEVARALHPSIIYCSITGYGQNGERRDAPGHDLNYMSVSGMLSLFLPQKGQPVVPRVPLADGVGAIAACEAILAALFQRERTGAGTRLDISLAATMQGLLGTHALLADALGSDQGCEALSGAVVCYNIYPTLDGRYVSLGALEAKFWQAFCRAMGHADWLPHGLSRAVPENPVYIEMVEAFASKDFAEWCDFATVHQCCLEPVLTPGEACEIGKKLGANAGAEVCNSVLEARGTERDRQETNLSLSLTDVAWEDGTIRQLDTHAGGFGQPRPPMTAPPSGRRLLDSDVGALCQSVWESIKQV